jgi:hypothetical protein
MGRISSALETGLCGSESVTALERVKGRLMGTASAQGRARRGQPRCGGQLPRRNSLHAGGQPPCGNSLHAGDSLRARTGSARGRAPHGGQARRGGQPRHGGQPPCGDSPGAGTAAAWGRARREQPPHTPGNATPQDIPAKRDNAQCVICVISVICGHYEHAHTRRGCDEVRKGLEGCEAATAQAGAGARERGAPHSPVFCGAKNAS